MADDDVIPEEPADAGVAEEEPELEEPELEEPESGEPGSGETGLA